MNSIDEEKLRLIQNHAYQLVNLHSYVCPEYLNKKPMMDDIIKKLQHFVKLYPAFDNPTEQDLDELIHQSKLFIQIQTILTGLASKHVFNLNFEHFEHGDADIKIFEELLSFLQGYYKL